MLIHGLGTLLEPGHESAAIAYLNIWGVPNQPPPPPDQLTLLLLTFNKTKKGQSVFFTGRVAFFLKNLCFQQSLRCYRNDLIQSTVIVKLPRGPY